MQLFDNHSLLLLLLRRLFFLAFVVLPLLLFACRQPEPADAVVKIGVIAYLQGEHIESEGLPTVNAANLALSDLEAAGGLIVNGRKMKVELVIEGIKQSKEASVAATRKLINHEGVNAIVGPQYSSDAIPSGGVAEQSGIPMICPVSTNPKTTAGRNYVFRMSFLDPAQGSAMALTALRDLHARRAAVIYNEADDYSRGIATVFRDVFATEGEIVAFEGYVASDLDLPERMQRIKQSQPEVLYIPDYQAQVVKLVRMAHEAGLEVVLLGADGWDQRIIPTLPDFDNSYFSLHWSALLPTEQARPFAEAYRREFVSEPNGTAALTYDAFQLLFRAIVQQQKSDPESIRNGLLAIGPYSGVGGVVDFIASGDPKKDVLIFHVKDGQRLFFKYGSQ